MKYSLLLALGTLLLVPVWGCFKSGGSSQTKNTEKHKAEIVPQTTKVELETEAEFTTAQLTTAEPTTLDCPKMIQNVVNSCYGSAIELKYCADTTTIQTCQKCSSCLTKAQECMLNKLQEQPVFGCPQARQSVASLKRLLQK
ncbi:unnamed protein product [Fasciola hepatica]|uniref:Uncharacterized protein n=1 Tax=Fasciola hepatica TaxID=6192 RepID=A0ABC9HEZ4_FASHE|nr:unnamed protein product [Fasciola hepatica]